MRAQVRGSLAQCFSYWESTVREGRLASSAPPPKGMEEKTKQTRIKVKKERETPEPVRTLSPKRELILKRTREKKKTTGRKREIRGRLGIFGGSGKRHWFLQNLRRKVGDTWSKEPEWVCLRTLDTTA